MSAPPHLFDRAALARHRRRAARALAHDQTQPADFLFRRVADDISDRLSVIKRTFTDAIDLGCHHGILARTLARDHAISSITCADECPAMLALAPRPGVAVDLERLPFAPASADLMVSALALHTVNDLPGTLAQIHAILRPDGLLIAALVGGRSLFELRDSFLQAEIEATGGAGPRVAPAIDVRDLGSLLQRARFALPVVDSDLVTVTYAHPLALFHDLRAMGATNCLAERPRACLRRDVLTRAIEIYRQRHANPDGRIRATVEILTATAWSPHASQQQPLKPGTATTRLADALDPSRSGQL